LTLPQIKKMLQTVLPLRSLTIEGAMSILKYTINRNHNAYLSHRKKRIQEAQGLGCEVSL
jgi:hypothetical protein